MLSCEEHLQKCHTAESAQLLLQEEDPNKYADWIVITAFYQALHWVDAFFALRDYQPLRHGPTRKGRKIIDEGRNETVRTDEDLKPIRDNYAALYKASIAARYDDDIYICRPDLVQELLEEHLAPIVTYMDRLVTQSQP